MAHMDYRPISLLNKFDKFKDQWSPKIIAQMNDYHFKIARMQGDFVWHDHKDTDEVFIVVEGELRIDFRDGSVMLKAGDLFVVPKGVEHKTSAQKESKILMIEPAGTVNTGGVEGDKTSRDNVWI